jgi:DNA-binding winged helix-turn-helix (wHTH) protein/Tol biopolymer transport system component
MGTEGFRYYEFDEYKIDARRRILFKNGERVQLSSRIFDLLLVLVQNEGRILEHDELLDKVWEGMFVEQSNLKKSVSALRQILGEQPNESLYIKTVPRRGYSFVAVVRAVPENPNEPLYVKETREEIIVEEEFFDDEPDEKVFDVNTPKALPGSQKSVNFRRFALICAAVLVLALIALAAWRFLRPQSTNFSVENVRTTKLINEGLAANNANISLDGKYIVYAVSEKGKNGLVVKQLSTGSVRTVISDESNVFFWGYNFAPDNEYVYYILHNFNDPSKSGLYKIPFLGGAAQRIAEKASGYITVAPDGKRLAFTRVLDDFHTEIVSINPDGSDERRIATFDDKYRIWGVVWTEDAENLLCTFRRQTDEKIVYYISEISIESGKEKIILPEQPNNLLSAVWLPGKQSVLFSMSEPNAIIRQIWQYFPATGERRRVTNDNVAYWFLSLARDGKTLVTVQETRPATIWTTDLDFKNFRQISTGTNEFQRAFWTADGKIVYQTTENRQESLWTIASDGTQKIRLTDGNDSYDMYPRISKSRQTITFISKRSGNSQIWSIDTDGRNARQLTVNLKTPPAESKLLNDGQTLVYSSYISPFGWTLFKRMPNGEDKQLTKVTVEAWDVSPDEHLIAFSGTDPQTQKPQIYVQNLETDEIIKTFNVRASHALCWTRDGQSIILGSRREGTLGEIMIQPLDGRPPKIYNSAESDRITSLDLSPDGQNLLVVRGTINSDIVLIQAGNTQ